MKLPKMVADGCLKNGRESRSVRFMALQLVPRFILRLHAIEGSITPAILDYCDRYDVDMEDVVAQMPAALKLRVVMELTDRLPNLRFSTLPSRRHMDLEELEAAQYRKERGRFRPKRLDAEIEV